MKKTHLKMIGKILLSGVLAFVILTCFSFFYYNLPVHSESADGSTDYVWSPHSFFSQATEGFASGRTNNEGFFEKNDYDPDTPTDILIMGSSHMEAYQVCLDESTAGRLDAALEDENVYSIGVAGHDFYVCAKNLEAAVKKYSPRKYIVFEVGSLSFSEEKLQSVLDGTLSEIKSYSSGFLGFLQRNPFLRLMYTQAKYYFKNSSDNGDDMILSLFQEESQKNDSRIEFSPLLDELLEKMKNTVTGCVAEIIFLYHPGTIVASDGTLVLPSDEDLSKFAELCEKHGVILLDMSDRFASEYRENHILPYGFANSSVGQGHLNKYGHAMIADELCKLIKGVK